MKLYTNNNYEQTEQINKPKKKFYFPPQFSFSRLYLICFSIQHCAQYLCYYVNNKQSQFMQHTSFHKCPLPNPIPLVKYITLKRFVFHLHSFIRKVFTSRYFKLISPILCFHLCIFPSCIMCFCVYVCVNVQCPRECKQC